MTPPEIKNVRTDHYIAVVYKTEAGVWRIRGCWMQKSLTDQPLSTVDASLDFATPEAAIGYVNLIACAA